MTEHFTQLDSERTQLMPRVVIPRPRKPEDERVKVWCRRSSRQLFPAQLALLLILAIPQTGCREGEADRSNRIVRDSAGIEIVSINPPHDTNAPRPTIEAEPTLSIGVVSGEGSHELSDVTGAIRLPDGRIVVGNGGTEELRFFAADGEHLFSTGGEGEGPGEFRSIDFIGLIGDDSLVVHDARIKRLSLFDVSGRFLGSHGPIDAPQMRLPRVVGVIGSRYYVSWSFVGQEPEQTGVYAVPIRFGMTELLSDNFVEAGTAMSSEESLIRYADRLTRAYRPFGRESDVAAGGLQIYVLTSTDDSGISVYDSAGRLVRILRIAIPTRPVDEAAVAAWTDSWIARYAGGSAEVEAYWRRGIRETPPPDHMPGIRSLEVDDAGNVCAERYPVTMNEETVYWCFSPEGQFVRSFRLPRGLARAGQHPHRDPQLQIGNDFVLGVWLDENDVQYVRLYGLLQ